MAGNSKFQLKKHSTYINMQPHVVLFANVRNVIDGVESSKDCRSRSTVDEERSFALDLSFLDKTFQFGGNHFAPRISRDQNAIVAAESSNHGRALDGVVTVLRSEHDKLRRQRPQPFRLVARKLDVPGGYERVQV